MITCERDAKTLARSGKLRKRFAFESLDNAATAT